MVIARGVRELIKLIKGFEFAAPYWPCLIESPEMIRSLRATGNVCILKYLSDLRSHAKAH